MAARELAAWASARVMARVTARTRVRAPAAALLRALRLGVGATLCLSALSCGGGGGTLAPSGGGTTPPTTGSNVVNVLIDAGPANNTVNTLYTTVTVCVPGSTTNCQAIDHIQVDTGSVGLRIISSALTVTLPGETAIDGNTLVECTVFADGYSWGPIALADVQISGESASSVPVQVIGDPGFTTIPSDCSSAGPMEEDTVMAFGANGILGIGFFAQDCGAACNDAVQSAWYYSCTSTQCAGTTVPVENQVLNPVSLFATDNNGTIIDLPNVADAGALTLTGSLIFGIDTQSNNASGTETLLTVAGSAGNGETQPGNLVAVYNSQSLDQSFIDSGSNGIFFSDSTIPACTDTGYTDFYCPTSELDLSVMLQGFSGVSASVNFTVDNAETLGSNNPTFVVLPTLAGPNPLSDSFDFGLSFFYGKRVATALEGQTTSVGTGPYVAF
jgi:hypothetical protein